jgi:hypothetical protein
MPLSTTVTLASSDLKPQVGGLFRESPTASAALPPEAPMAGEDHPDERTFLGLCLRDYALLQGAETAWGITGLHFRLDLHRRVFGGIIEHCAKGHANANIESLRTTTEKSTAFIVQLADAALRRSGGDDEKIEALVRETAKRIVSSIRSVKDRAVWRAQLFKSCGRQEIGPSEFLLGYAIGEHVRHATGRAFPGYELLAKETGQSVKTIERGITALRVAKHLSVDRRRPVTFVPIVWAKLDAAKQAAAKRTPTAQSAKRPAAVATEVLEDSIPF